MPTTNDAEATRATTEAANRLSETVLGYRRERLASAPPARGEFEEWLDAQPTFINKIQVVRQSSKLRREYARHFETATAYREADPDVAAVRAVDLGDLLDGVVSGMSAFRIERRHLRGGGRSQAYVGTAVAVGRTLFLFILNSAAEGNLKGDHDDLAGNAFTVAVQVCVRRMSYARWREDLTSRLWVYFPDKSRLCRDERHAINLVETLAWAGVVLVITSQVFPNLDDASAKLVIGIFLSLSSQELETIVQRLFGPRFGILRAGEWLGQEAPPITHRIPEETRSDGRQTWEEKNVHRIVPRDDAIEMLTSLIDTILSSAGDNLDLGPAGTNPDPKAIPDWKHVARVAGSELGVESRDWNHLRRGGLAIHRLSGGGATNIRRYLEPRWVEGWRTGRTPWSLSIPKVIASTFQVQLTENQEWDERPDGTVAVLSRMEMPLPRLTCEDGCDRDGHLDGDGNHLSHGFGIPDWKWDRLQELLERTASRSGEHVLGRGNGSEARRYPFASTFQWDEGDRQFKLMAAKSTKHGPTYQLYARAGAPDPTRAWTKGPDEVCLATFPTEEMHAAVGADLERLLRAIDQQLEPLVLTEERAEDDQPTMDPVATAEKALGLARAELAKAEQVLSARRRTVLVAKTEAADLGDDADADEIHEARAQLDEAERMLQEAKEAKKAAMKAVKRCEAQVAAAATTEADAVAERTATVDLSAPVLVAKSLQKAEGATSRVLNDAVLRLLDPTTSRIEVHDDDHTKVTVRPTWRFVTADTHEVLTHQRTVHIERLPANPKTKTKNVDVDQRDRETIPRLLLGDGLSRAEVGRRFRIGFEPGNTRAYGYQIVREWLDGHGVSRKLHHALLDAPPVVRRTLYLALTGDQGALDEHLADMGCKQDYAELLVSRYTGEAVITRGSWAATWTPGDHADDRAVIDTLDAYGGRATIEQVAAETGLPHERAARVAHVVPHSQRHLASPKFGQPAAVGKGEWRSKAVPLEDRELWLLTCPHDDCDGYLTRPLWTPETDPDVGAEHQHAALCETCRRTPWSTVRFPADYLRQWSGPTNRRGQSSGRRETTLSPACMTGTRAKVA